MSWGPAPWPKGGEADIAQRTSDISAVIQEIVNQGGWVSGNALVLLVSGSGKRVAESYRGDPDGAPLLHVEYVEPPIITSVWADLVNGVLYINGKNFEGDFFDREVALGDGLTLSSDTITEEEIQAKLQDVPD